MRSVLWKSDYDRINQQFLKLLDEPLRDGITILFQAGISYDPLHGLSLRIVDIDPTFVLGELEKEKKESIKRLHAEGIFDANKRLPFPTLPKRLAIISVETSKGLSDFYKIIRNNPWHYKLECTLYPALLQGDKSIPSILNQLASIRDQMEEFDAVTIIRGGGGEVGLASYNNYQLAKAVAEFPLPVLTGIGHATNETVCEMVAYKNAITPSNLAEFLLQHFHDFSNILRAAEQQIAYRVERKFSAEREKISYSINTINWRSQNLMQRAKQIIENNKVQVIAGSNRIFEEQRRHIANSKTIIKLADPVTILNKGFAMVWHNGKIVTSSTQINEGDTIVNQLRDGEVQSKVLKINEHGRKE